MPSTLTLRNISDDLISNLQQATQQKTASKALVYAAEDFLRLRAVAADRADQIQSLQAEVNRLQSIIEAARFAAAELLDKTSQSDFFAAK